MNEKRFSLIELLVVIGIIGILASIILPALAGSKKAATRTEARAEMKQLEFAILGFISDNANMPQQLGYDSTIDVQTTSSGSTNLMRMLNDAQYQKDNKCRVKRYIDGKFKYNWTVYLDTNWDHAINVGGNLVGTRVYIEGVVEGEEINNAEGK